MGQGLKILKEGKKTNYVSPCPLGRSTGGRDPKWAVQDVLPSAELVEEINCL